MKEELQGKKYLDTTGLSDIISKFATIVANLKSQLEDLETSINNIDNRIKAIEDSSIDNVDELYNR